MENLQKDWYQASPLLWSVLLKKMKTIFISIFEGVEAKNILRTPVLDTLLCVENIRIVLFTKSAERADYYRKEFNNPNIFYEVVERVEPSGLNAFFSKLKFTLLRTPSTDQKRKMILEDEGSYIHYILGLFFNRLLARRWVRSVARRLDYWLVRTNIYEMYFEKYKPDIVFLAHLFDEPEINFLREAKRRGVKTLGLINSWDKVTTRCILRLFPDKLVVFNETVKKELIKYDDFPGEKVFISGLPQYDIFFKKPATVSSREVFFKKIGFLPNKRIILYAPISGRKSNWDIIDLLHSLNQQKKFGENVEILVRFQPNDFVEEKDLKMRPWLHYDYPGKRFSSKRGVDWDMDTGDLNHLVDTLNYISVLVCYGTSLSIDAAVFDRPVINLDFELHKSEKLRWSPTQFYTLEHYSKALSNGGIRIVRDTEELVRWINTYLETPHLDKEGRENLVLQQCGVTDGKAGERIGNLVISMINEVY